MLVSDAGAFRRVRVYPVRMSWFDVVIAALVVVSGLRGWSQGLLRQLGAFVGRVIGLVGGSYLAVAVAPRAPSVVWRPLEVILIIIACTVAGGLIMRYFGGVFSNRLHEGRLGLADSVLGASVGVVGMLVTCWFVAALLTVVPWSSVGQSINKSVILKYVQRVLPSPPAVESRLQGVLSQLNVPSLFADVVAPSLAGSGHGVLSTRHHVALPSGVVTVKASGGCGLSSLGTGFVVAPNEVVTVAHLLAGEKSFVVGGRLGHVVVFDPVSDLAVVRTSGLNAAPLTLAASSPSRSSAQVVGYQSPIDRVATGAIFLGSVTGPGRDIFSGPVFTRTMDVVAASITASEYGAPVLVNGDVVGVAAARVVADTSLTYAVTLTQLRQQIAHVSSTAVSTQRCVN